MMQLSLNRMRHSFKRWELKRRQAALPALEDRYVHMFIEDTVNSLLPFRGAPDVDFSIELSVSPPGTRQLIEQAFGERRGYPTAEDIADFLRESARILLAIHLVIFWSESLHDEKGDAAETKFAIRYGDVTRSDQLRSGNSKMDQVEIDLPKYIQRDYRHIVEGLTQLSGALFPDFVAEGRFLEERAFDLNHYRRTETIAFLDATRSTGWSARDRLSGELLEYYVLERYLRFEKFKASLRATLLKGLNELLMELAIREAQES